MSTNLTIKINKALKIQGNYYIGSWYAPVAPDGGGVGTGNLVASEYFNYTVGGVQHSFSPGYWNWLLVRASLPWGNLAYGKRPSRFGCGMLWSGDQHASSESTVLGVNYGPFRFGLSFYPSRVGDAGYNYFDKTGLRELNFAHAVHYISGDLMMGYQMTHVQRHRGAELGSPSPFPGQYGTARNTGSSRDLEDIYYGLYLKYFNGRFFFNTEYDAYSRRIITLRAPLAAGRRYNDFEFQDWMIETGFLFGPAKLSLIYSRVTGIDRRGTRSGNNSIFKNNTLPTGNLANTLVFQPYSYLMVYMYGLGLGPSGTTGQGQVPNTGYGQVMGASVYGARLDYAVACNLNVYGTFFYAVRPEKGYGWGFLTPNPGNGTTRRQVGGQSGTSPAIPDDYLGWEVDLGVDWQLLEGYLLSMRFARWEVGDWFKYACVDKSNPAWATGALQNAGNLWGCNPERAIDPVYAFNLTLNAEF
jgi:hypothetical protein